MFLFALVGLKIAMDGNPIARKGLKFPSLKKFHRSQLIQNSNWKFHPLQICITSQFLNLHHWQPNRTAADKKYSVWILLTQYHEYRGMNIIVTCCCPKVYNNRLCTRKWQEQGLVFALHPSDFFSVLHPDSFFQWMDDQSQSYKTKTWIEVTLLEFSACWKKYQTNFQRSSRDDIYLFASKTMIFFCKSNVCAQARSASVCAFGIFLEVKSLK